MSYHSNKYAVENACLHCEGIIRHEKWCIIKNKRVRYAYDLIINPDKITEQDKLILRALGVLWPVCAKKCKAKTDKK